MHEPPMLLRAAEAAKLLALGRTKVYELMANGSIPSVKIGRAVRIPRAGLERWVRQQAGDEAGDPQEAA
jgi:excisionase family DNA binding protein